MNTFWVLVVVFNLNLNAATPIVVEHLVSSQECERVYKVLKASFDTSWSVKHQCIEVITKQTTSFLLLNE